MQFSVPVQQPAGDPKKLEAAQKAIRAAAKGAWQKAQEAKPPLNERETIQAMMEAGLKAVKEPVEGLNVESEVLGMMVGTSGGIRETVEETEGGDDANTQVARGVSEHFRAGT